MLYSTIILGAQTGEQQFRILWDDHCVLRINTSNNYQDGSSHILWGVIKKSNFSFLVAFFVQANFPVPTSVIQSP